MFNLKDLDRPNWLIVRSKMIPKQRGIVGVCGKWATNPVPAQYGFFYADSVKVVSAIGNKGTQQLLIEP